MSGKSVPFSARISLEDASFISSLKYAGAITPSDKLRAILADARKMQQRNVDYASNLQHMQDWLNPLKQQWQTAQQQLDQQTDISLKLLEWLPDLLALLLSQTAQLTPTASQMQQLDNAVLQRIVRLNEAILPLAIRQPASSNGTAVNPQQQLWQLAELILTNRDLQQGETT